MGSAAQDCRRLSLRRLLRQSTAYYGSRFASGAVALVALSLYSRLLSPADFGTYALVQASAMIGFGIIFQWLCVAAVRLLPSTAEPDSLQAQLGYLFALGATIGIVIAAAGAIVTPPDSRRLLAMTWALFATHGWLELNLHIYSARLEAFRYAQLSVVRSLFGTTCGAGLAYIGMGVDGVLWGNVVGLLVPSLWIGISNWRRARFGPNRAQLESVLRFGMPLALSFFLLSLTQRADRLLVAALAGVAPAGIYAMAVDLANRLLRMVVEPIGNATLPLAVHAYERGGAAAASTQIRRNFGLVVAIGFPAAFGICFAAPTLASVLLGVEYRADAGTLLPIAALATLAVLLRANYVDQIWHLLHRTKELSRLALATLAFSLSLSLILIPLLGASGAAVAALVVQTAAFLVGAYLVRNLFRFSLPYRDITRVAVATAVMGLTVIAAGAEDSPAGLLLLVAGGAGAYGVTLALLSLGWIRDRLRAIRRKGWLDG